MSRPRPLRELALSLYILRLRLATRRCRSLEDYLAVTRRARLGPLRIAPMQADGEILELLAELRRRSPVRILEIGTARGGTLYLFARVAAENARLLSIDLSYPSWKQRLFRSFAGSHQTIDLLLADSCDPATVQRVKRHFSAAPLDFVYIDGDHAYDAVRQDFANYAPLVSPGGLVALHDIRPGPEHRVGGVPEFWQELRRQYSTSEILDPDVKEGFGLGLVRM